MGRDVRTLVAGEELLAGRHQRSWDGRDNFGAAVPAGVYLVRLQAGGHASARRLVLVR
jgi:flagellar hook assembly protein FlgD